MKELFQEVLDTYIDGKDKVDSKSQVHDTLVHKIPRVIRERYANRNDLIVKGSDGQGNKSEYPWIAILNKNITTNAQYGLYIVYLFRKDMKGFYITISQGITNFENLYKSKKYEYVQRVSEYFRTQIEDITFINDKISLKDDNEKDKGYAYEKTIVTSKYYPTEQFNDEVMFSDLDEMLNTYDYMCEHLLGNSYDEIIKNVLEDENDNFSMSGEEAVGEIEKVINPDNEMPFGITVTLKEVIPEPKKEKKFTKVTNPVLRKTDYLKKQTKDIKNGLKGEKFVLDYEMDKLRKLGLDELADKVRWAAKISDTFGYDIESYDMLDDGSVVPLKIEVKSTSSKTDTEFFVSKNEVDASKKYRQNYCVYRLYDIDSINPKFYKAYGCIEDNFILDPVTFTARYKYPNK